jgi:thioredoxin-dependent peroxiredoxin
LNRIFPGRTVAALTLAAASLLSAAPPAVRDKAPDFTLNDIKGETVRLSQALGGDKPVVLVVLRGYPGYQCPFCSRQVQDLTENATALAAVSSRVILVYPGPAADLKQRASEFTKGKALPANFDLVLDPDFAFTTLYDLRWNAPDETAYPATFIIDPQGEVVFAKVSRSHGGRTKASEILEFLRRRTDAAR